MDPAAPATLSIPAALSAPFTEGLRLGVLRYQRCTACGCAQTLVRYACRHCGNEGLAWHDAAGSATVRAVTVVMRAPSDEFRPLAPYTLVLVELDEGPRLMGHAAPGMQIGDRVRAGFFEHRGGRLIRFEAMV
ncbi:MAG TPA: OB-fold domain-containing protein [Burkholderiaceae bacterium]|nr:OB-fold domain-containing protein [Burkholderiaceae bacterium]